MDNIVYSTHPADKSQILIPAHIEFLSIFCLVNIMSGKWEKPCHWCYTRFLCEISWTI